MSSSGRGIAVRPSASAGASLPPGAITQAAGSRTTTSRVNVAIRPVGEVEYDGQTLPVLDPSGRWVTVQIGAPVGLREGLGLSSTVSEGAGIALYRIPSTDELAANPRAGLEAVPLPELPPGLILGRGATREGVLVEAPQPDGSRWVGLLGFEARRVNWLVQDGRVNAQAVMTARGDLLWCRRSVQDQAWTLMSRPAAGGEGVVVELPEGSPMLPMLTPGGEDAGVLLHAAGGLSVVALERRDESWRAGKPIALGRGGPAEAVQAVASLEAMPGPTTSAGGVLERSLLLVHPLQQRVSVLEARSGAMALLPAGTIAATRVMLNEREGLATSTEAALAWIACGRAVSGGGVGLGERAALMSGPMLARGVVDAPGRMIVLGPGRSGGAPRLSVAVTQILPSEGPPGPGDDRAGVR